MTMRIFTPFFSSFHLIHRYHLEAAGHSCVLKDTCSCGSLLALSDLIASENVEAAVGIHLYKAGRLLQGTGLVI